VTKCVSVFWPKQVSHGRTSSACSHDRRLSSVHVLATTILESCTPRRNWEDGTLLPLHHAYAGQHIRVHSENENESCKEQACQRCHLPQHTNNCTMLDQFRPCAYCCNSVLAANPYSFCECRAYPPASLRLSTVCESDVQYMISPFTIRVWVSVGTLVATVCVYQRS
jgi:hypothetical protein